MQKFLKFAEQHVQWLAIGLGAIYLAWMGYSYAYQNSLVVNLGPHPAHPGEVDSMIADGPIKQLEQQILNPTHIAINPPDVLADFRYKLGDAGAIVSNLPPVFRLDPHGDEILAPEGPVGPQVAVLALPAIPEPDFLAIAAYRTKVQYPDPNFVPPKEDPAAVAPMIQGDIDAVSVEFNLDTKKVLAEFTKAFGQNTPVLSKTMYLQVNLFREELGRDGATWSSPILVPPLKIHVMQPYPGDTPAEEPAVIYEAWAGGDQQDIVQPAFYDIVAGNDAWYPPDNPPVVAPAVGPAAAAPPAPLAQPVIITRGTPGLPKDNPRTFNGPVGDNAPPPQAPQPTGAPTDSTLAPLKPHFAPGGFAAGAGGQGLGNVFNLIGKTNDDIILAHDDTVQPDKTYRYFVQYRLLNPVFGNNRLFKPALAKQFALVSPGPKDKDATPSAPITIPSRSQIYVKSIQRGQVTFAVFVWKPGPYETTIIATPGDSIAPTRWTVVDIRQDTKAPRGWYVILVDDDGNTQRRDFEKDKVDQKFHDLENLVAGPAAAASSQ